MISQICFQNTGNSLQADWPCIDNSWSWRDEQKGFKDFIPLLLCIKPSIINGLNLSLGSYLGDGAEDGTMKPDWKYNYFMSLMNDWWGRETAADTQ